MNAPAHGHPGFDLSGKVVAVTGGSRGIGFGMATGLARAGASVAILGRSRDGNRAACGRLAELGATALPVACDVNDSAQVEAALDAVRDELGPIDACFANAGIDGARLAPFVDMTDREWREVMGTNLDGAMYTLRAAARHMLKDERPGSLVVTSSLGAVDGFPRNEHYSASKAGVLALARGLAVELAKASIRCNAILPGLIDTDMSAPNRDHLTKRVLPRVPAGRWGSPEDFEGVAVYLVSDLSRYQTGTTIVIDGGYTVS